MPDTLQGHIVTGQVATGLSTQANALPDDSVFRFEDSLNETESTVNTVQHINLFSHHAVQVKHENPIPVNRFTPDWVFPVILVVLAMFTFLRIFYSRYFSRLFSAFVNANLANQVVRDENILIQRASVLLNVVFYMVGALFLFFISAYSHWDISGLDFGFSRFVFFILLVSGVYTLKLIILKFCGYIFGLDREMAAYIFNIFLVNSVLGMVLLPFIGLLAFADWPPTLWIIRASVTVILAAFAYRLTRGVLIGFGSPYFSAVYLILYLCALEIAPLLVVVKLVIA
jgi:hypothetical protein